MQTAKNAAESLKETAANVTASAKSGMDKTKATAQDKGERMSAHDPMEKEMATQKKEERLNEAEFAKGAHSSGMSGPGIDHPTGPVMGGTIPSHPAGMNTEITGTTTTGHNTNIGAVP